jgi:hypothetical protein
MGDDDLDGWSHYIDDNRPWPMRVRHWFVRRFAHGDLIILNCEIVAPVDFELRKVSLNGGSMVQDLTINHPSSGRDAICTTTLMFAAEDGIHVT